MRSSSAGMEVAPSGDQDLRSDAGRVVRQAEVARLVMSLTLISLTLIQQPSIHRGCPP